jgi:cell division GTPase FtsZ
MAIADALRDPAIRGALVTFRANEATTLRRIDRVQALVAEAMRLDALLELGSPCIDGRAEEVIVTVIESERRP